MTEAESALLGALIGAVAGVAGGGLAAMASLRASQLAARAPLGPILHEIGNTIISMNVTKGTPDYVKHRRDFERKWNEFSIQQRILCPSEKIVGLSGFVQAVARSESDPPEALLSIAGQTMEKITQMVSAHSTSLFRWRARRLEAQIMRRWLESKEAELLSEPVRAKLAALNNPQTTSGRLLWLTALAATLGMAIISGLWLKHGAPTEFQFILGTLVFGGLPAILVWLVGSAIRRFLTR
jgi:hypothetical protein